MGTNDKRGVAKRIEPQSDPTFRPGKEAYESAVFSDDRAPNKLYLYFPSSDDATYPEFGAAYGIPASPAKTFDTANLTSFSGNAADLRGAITQIVKEDYCELAVEVIETTTAPPNTYARRNTVAIGTDTTSDGTFGLAQAVDSGDANAS